mmetsp:Transcript_30892/g.77148  ORF Transcript_30892/g.77148 Transcript_30892/m.77148 type:complete len:220 (-) Transcript_30892:125-784(-)
MSESEVDTHLTLYTHDFLLFRIHCSVHFRYIRVVNLLHLLLLAFDRLFDGMCLRLLHCCLAMSSNVIPAGLARFLYLLYQEHTHLLGRPWNSNPYCLAHCFRSEIKFRVLDCLADRRRIRAIEDADLESIGALHQHFRQRRERHLVSVQCHLHGVEHVGRRPPRLHRTKFSLQVIERLLHGAPQGVEVHLVHLLCTGVLVVLARFRPFPPLPTCLPLLR